MVSLPILLKSLETGSDVFRHVRHYLFGAAAVYLTSVVIRFGLLFVRNGRKIARGHVEALLDDSVRVTITLPRRNGHRWSAGQHYFINFLKVRPLESHPYTIANAPYSDASSSVSTSLRLYPASTLTRSERSRFLPSLCPGFSRSSGPPLPNRSSQRSRPASPQSCFNFASLYPGSPRRSLRWLGLAEPRFRSTFDAPPRCRRCWHHPQHLDP